MLEKKTKMQKNFTLTFFKLNIFSLKFYIILNY